MSNDAAREQAINVLAGLQSQMADIAAVHQRQAVLRVDAQAAEGTVEVTVNARGQLVKVVIDKSYLDDHDFDELGGSILEAAQAAAEDARQQVTEMLAPINERRKSLPTFSDIVESVPSASDLTPPGLDGFLPAPSLEESFEPSVGDGYDDGNEGGAEFPIVRRRTGG
ncbi:MAG: YbaB/EbfC family nucleoid-associated protein [Mycobacterium sp.]|nr:YbaB/EbfC family nucleoid-associated protein [Mycobacterium sp.]